MITKKISLAILLSVGTIFSASSVLAGDIEAGKAKSAVCAACHGQNGVSLIPIYPNLAGQKELYITSSLKAYKDKQRGGGMAVIMQGQAANLTDEDIANLSAYYSSLPAGGK